MLRPTAKTDGLCKLVEGKLDSGSPVVVVDDLVNCGKTLLRTVEVMRNSGYEIAAAMCVFQFEWGKANCRRRQLGVDVVPLAMLRDRSKDSNPSGPQRMST
jgi:orotate phosphoribosyltransferase